MRQHHRLASASLTSLTALLVAALGCGGGEKTSTPAPSPTTTVPKTAAAPTTLPAAPTDEEEPAPLLAWADASVEEGKAPLTVEFKADTEGGKPPLKYVWKFGDGTPDSTDANPKHTYEKPGKYRADLEVADSAGDSDSDYMEIDVQ
jgi:PKD repeat protein